MHRMGRKGTDLAGWQLLHVPVMYTKMGFNNSPVLMLSGQIRTRRRQG